MKAPFFLHVTKFDTAIAIGTNVLRQANLNIFKTILSSDIAKRKTNAICNNVTNIFGDSIGRPPDNIRPQFTSMFSVYTELTKLTILPSVFVLQALDTEKTKWIRTRAAHCFQKTVLGIRRNQTSFRGNCYV